MNRQYGQGRQQGGQDEEDHNQQHQQYRGYKNKQQKKKNTNSNYPRGSSGQGPVPVSTGANSSSYSGSTNSAFSSASENGNKNLASSTSEFKPMQEVHDQEFVAANNSNSSAVGSHHIGDGDTNSNLTRNDSIHSKSSSEFVSATEDSFSVSSFETNEVTNQNYQQNNLTSTNTFNNNNESSSSNETDSTPTGPLDSSSEEGDHVNGNHIKTADESYSKGDYHVSTEFEEEEDETPTTPTPVEESYTQASLIVNLSAGSPSSFNFTQEQVDVSPLSSARSAPPDLEHQEDPDNVKNDDIVFSSTSTPRSVIKTVGGFQESDFPVLSSVPKTVTFDPKPTLVFDDEESKADQNEAVSDSTINVTDTSVEVIDLVSEDDSSTNSFKEETKSQINDSFNVSTTSNADLTLELGSSASIKEEAKEELEETDKEVSEINWNDSLPKTVTKLQAANGAEVYLIGTAHFSLESQNDVVKTIHKVQPKVVVLELCHARRHILAYDEETILREVQNLNFEKIRHTLRQSGAIQGALHLLLLSMSCSLTKKLGMAPGGEFRIACREAQKLQNCQILFGDRVFSVTLARALHSLSFLQKVKLTWQFLTTNDDITKEEIERCKEKDILEQMLEEMTGEYPSISNVFVAERDIYLAHSLWLAALSTEGPVVGVVGMGHVPGMKKQWGQTNESMVNQVNEMPKSSMTSIVIRKAIRIGFYCLVGYGIYKVGQKVVTRLPISSTTFPQTFGQFRMPTSGYFKRI